MSRSTRPGLYVHVPFCSAICPYCDFAVVTGDGARRSRYVEHLLRELDVRTELAGFDTLYFGGGTPSLLDADDLRRICDQAPLAESCRIYLEANPEDVSRDAVASWREIGVDTLSLGVQAFDDDALSFLGRRHTAAEAEAAVEIAREGGFDTVSIDLIFGLPHQPESVWQRTLERAIDHRPDHISCYQLTIHDGTLFGRRRRQGRLEEMSSDAQGELFRATHRRLADAGYEGYEVSNFAKGAEHRSQHNEKYWDHTPYLGVGPSAHSFDGRKRSWNVRSLFAWQERIGEVEGSETLDDGALLLERVMLRLRTRDGLDLGRVHEQFGVDLAAINRELIESWCEQGLAELDGARLRPSVDGLAIADSLASSFEIPTERWQRTLR